MCRVSNVTAEHVSRQSLSSPRAGVCSTLRLMLTTLACCFDNVARRRRLGDGSLSVCSAFVPRPQDDASLRVCNLT